MSEDAYYELERLFTQAKKRPAFGNGRFVRNIFEKTCNAQAVRLDQKMGLNKDELSLINVDDVKAIVPELNNLTELK